MLNAYAVLIEPCRSNLVFCYDAVVQYGVLWTEYRVYICGVCKSKLALTTIHT